MSITLPISLSPCPNDTFPWYAFVENKFENPFQCQLEYNDIEILNSKALNNYKGVIKISFKTYFQVKRSYELLKVGSALGYDCGPLLITNKKIKDINTEVKTIAIPGFQTTATALLHWYLQNKNIQFVEMNFATIEDAVLSGIVDAGLIIHEGRFTYKEKGLKLLIDLGEYWHEQTQTPLPLGAVVIHRAFTQYKEEIEKWFLQSAKYAYENKIETLRYCKLYAQELDDEVIQQHIDLYVNNQTLCLDDEGKRAIEKLNDIFAASLQNFE